MNNKKLIIICLIYIFFSCCNLFAYRAVQRDKTCFANIRIIENAIYSYNMNNQPHIVNLDQDAIKKLIKNKFLEKEPIKPDKLCEYKSIGDLSQDGMVFCTYHGDLFHIIYCDYYKDDKYEQYKKLPQDTTIEEIKKNSKIIMEERNKHIEKERKKGAEKVLTEFIRNLLFWSLIIIIVAAIIIELIKEFK
ncbi:MAG: hypothetical protein IKO19_08255 [Candidatus Riflebacteria bacterium]|nr:hypothetical protein [Candidatus Riflebacteria bacterium]